MNQETVLEKSRIAGQETTTLTATMPIRAEQPIGAKKRFALRASIKSIDNLNPVEIERMYQLFSKYYENHSRTTFQQDLLEKNHVILLRDKKTNELCGFSTLLNVALKTDHGRARGIYSGDTVIEKNYWGSPALGMAFLQYLWRQKIKSPFQPVYWFLISKGYKTYLLMANNFALHYPRFEKETPTYFKKLMDDFYLSRFGNAYNKHNGQIRFQSVSCRLKNEVADITPEMLRIPRVAFFQHRNPDWRNGTELACLAEMTYLMPLRYAIKKTYQNMMNLVIKNKYKKQVNS